MTTLEDAPPAVRVRAPSSLGLTVLLDASVRPFLGRLYHFAAAE